MKRLMTSMVALVMAAACGNDDAVENAAPTHDKTEQTDTMASPNPKTAELNAPIAQKRPEQIEQFGETRTDNYFWMKDENWQEVLRDPSKLRADIKEHLDAENAYYEASTGDLAKLRDMLFEEMRGRIKEDDSSVPSKDGPYAYSVRYREGGQYAIYVRTPRDGGTETMLLDGDKEGEGEKFFDVEDVAHSPDHSMIAYGVDRLGSEYYDIRIRVIESGEELDETISSTDGSAIWATDSKSFYYVERDDNQRPKRVKRHVLGTDPSTDALIYEEPDDSYFLSLYKSQSGDYVFILSSKATSSEARFLRADAAPGTPPTLIAPRADDELYYPEHHGDTFLLHTNAGGAVDFKISKTPVTAPGRENWEDWLAHEPGTYVTSFTPYKDWLVRLERKNALPQIVVSSYDGESFEIDFEEEAYALGLSAGYEYDTDVIRFSYESPSTPEQTFDYGITSKDRTLLKTQEVPSGHNPGLYKVERLTIEAEDGASIPVTVLRLKDTPVDGSAPLLLYGYGSYGITIPAGFSTSILSVVDRGAIYAVGHIRGGAARGRQWYLDGKLDKKPNTFSDFAAVAEGLAGRGYGKEGEIVIYGGSAGGLLVGATVNLRPDLFGGVIGAVPFVDVLNTISDGDLPLTPPEWVEWGNPITDEAAYQTIKSYSPYDNIKQGVNYPPVLATGGLTDYRVTYWEPAKWIARLREEASGGPFYLKMNMEAGHGGSAARFERMKERAHDYAFALKIFGLTDQDPVSHK